MIEDNATVTISFKKWEREQIRDWRFRFWTWIYWPWYRLARWQIQIATLFEDLLLDEQEADLNEADRVLAILKEML